MQPDALLVQNSTYFYFYGGNYPLHTYSRLFEPALIQIRLVINSHSYPKPWLSWLGPYPHVPLPSLPQSSLCLHRIPRTHYQLMFLLSSAAFCRWLDVVSRMLLESFVLEGRSRWWDGLLDIS